MRDPARAVSATSDSHKTYRGIRRRAAICSGLRKFFGPFSFFAHLVLPLKRTFEAAIDGCKILTLKSRAVSSSAGFIQLQPAHQGAIMRTPGHADLVHFIAAPA